jgi:hypothetical protein
MLNNIRHNILINQIFQLLHLYYDIYFLPQFKIKNSSQHRATRRSSSCHTILHIHVSICVMWRQNINHNIWNTTYTFRHNTKFKTRHSPSQLVMPHECAHPRSIHLICDDKKVIHYICNTTYIFHRNTKFKARHIKSLHVAARIVMPHDFTHSHFNTCNATTKISIITSEI